KKRSIQRPCTSLMRSTGRKEEIFFTFLERGIRQAIRYRAVSSHPDSTVQFALQAGILAHTVHCPVLASRPSREISQWRIRCDVYSGWCLQLRGQPRLCNNSLTVFP